MATGTTPANIQELMTWISQKFGEEVGYWVQQEIETLTQVEQVDIADLRNKIDTIDAILDGDDANTQSAVRNIIATIAEHTSQIGDLSTLNTTNKTDLVGAINEVKGVADTAKTTADSAVASIGDLSTLNTTEKSNVVGAINELKVNIDILANADDVYTKTEIDDKFIPKTDVTYIVLEDLVCMFRTALQTGKNEKLNGDDRSVICSSVSDTTGA